ncbi:MAG TPA: hypothetical protein VGE46_09110 [Bdellovibrio sp.]
MKKYALVLLMFCIKAQALNLPFKDKDLNAYLKKHQNGVIYILSPHMYLSLKGYPEYESIAKKHRLSFLPLLDPMASTLENTVQLDLKNISVLSSKVLLQKDAVLHFPSYVFFRNGKILGRFNPGYDAPDKYEERLVKVFE